MGESGFGKYIVQPDGELGIEEASIHEIARFARP